MQHEKSSTNSLNEPADFLGRQAKLAQFFEYFQPYATPAINIIGLWGSGKTALLQYVRRPAVLSAYLNERADYFCLVFVDMHGLHRPEEFSERLIRQVMKVANVRSEPRGRSWPERLQSILGQVEDRRVVVLLDRFDLLFKEDAFEDEFFGALRSLIDNADLGCVTTSHRPLDECWSQVRQRSMPALPYRMTRPQSRVPPPAPSPLYNVFQPIRLGAMEPDDLDKLIAYQTKRANLILAATDATWIKTTAGGLPDFVRRATQDLIDAYRHHVPAPERQLVANNTFRQQAGAYLSHIWDTLTADEQSVLRLLISPDPTDWAAYERNHGQSALLSLQTYGLISSTRATYAINGAVLADWVQYQAPLLDDPGDDDICGASQAIKYKRRRLAALQAQAAIKGISAPPEVVTEIEDLQREISEYERPPREING